MKTKHNLMMIALTFFLFGAIFIFAGEVNQKIQVSKPSNLAGVVVALEDLGPIKQKYQILSSNLGEYNAIKAFSATTAASQAAASTNIAKTESEMRAIEDILIGKMETSEYYDFIKSAEKEEKAAYSRTESTFINGKPIVDQAVTSEPKMIVTVTNSQTVGQDSTFGKKSYVPLSVLPGLTNSANSTLTLKPFLKLLFKWGIAIAVILSIIMITIGGFQYMTTDAVFSKSEGRAKINAAIVGLLLALSAWLILQTVDPRILQEPQSAILN